jgi:hypothetical protein
MTSRKRKLCKYLPIIILSASLGVACQSISTRPLASVTAECPPSGRMASAFTVAHARLDPKATGIRWVGEPALAPTQSEAIEIRGVCAGTIQGYRMGSFALLSGEGFAYHPDIGIQDWENASGAIAAASLPPDVVPRLSRGQFISATPTSPPLSDDGPPVRWYIGLWRDADSWIIARFALIEGRAPSQAEPLFRSSLPVNGVTYFPSVDTNEGRITILQVINQNKARAVGFDVDF